MPEGCKMPQPAEEGYQSPLSTRYAGPEMQRLFSELHRARLFRELWLILAEGQRELGLPITERQVAQLRAHTQTVDLERVARLETELRHDVMAHLKAYAADCPDAAPILHLGATSCYVTDNADVMMIRDALLLLRARLVGVVRRLSAFARAHKAQPALAYTHFQPAQPTTLGKRACLWLQDVLSDLAELEHFLKTLRPLGSKGATGTQASFLSLFSGDHEKVKALDDYVARRMGFEKPVSVSGQTYSRKTDSRALQVLSGIAQSAYKFSNDVRLLQHLKEVEEPFGDAQVGSSAMPYKRNPMRCERMAGLARFMINNTGNAEDTAAAQWLERTLDDSANRRLALAQGFLTADGLLRLYDSVAGGLVVYPKMMDKHLREELPFIATENILMQAVLLGGNRQALHERLRAHAMAAGSRVKNEGLPNDLLPRVADDPAFGLTLDALEGLLDPKDYTGRAERQVDEYLDGEVAEQMAGYTGIGAAESDVRV